MNIATEAPAANDIPGAKEAGFNLDPKQNQTATPDFSKHFKRTQGDPSPEMAPTIDPKDPLAPAQTLPTPEVKTTKSGFIEKTKTEAKEAKEQAEKERLRAEALAAEVAELKTKLAVLPELEEKVKTYKAPEEYETTAKERDELKNRLEERERKLSEAQKKVEFYDYANSEDFTLNYKQPLDAAWRHIGEIVGQDEEKLALLARIGNAHEVAVNGAPEARQRAERERDSLIEQVSEGLAGYKQRQFDTAIMTMQERSISLSKALQNHQTNLARDKELAQERQRMASETVKQNWKSKFDEAGEHIAPLLTVSETLKPYMPADINQIDDQIANQIISGSTQITTQDMTRIIRQGAAHPTLAAKVTAQDKLIAELQSTIATLRGTSTASLGSTSTTTGTEPQAPKTEAEKREEEGRALVSKYFTPRG